MMYVSQGWQCPICGRILAPFVPECPCKGQGPETITTTGTGTVELNKEVKTPNITAYFESELKESKGE